MDIGLWVTRRDQPQLVGETDLHGDVPDIRQVDREIARVLKPRGELIMMVHAKWSFNYLVAIGLLRRLGLLALYGLNFDRGGIYGSHVATAKWLPPKTRLTVNTRRGGCRQSLHRPGPLPSAGILDLIGGRAMLNCPDSRLGAVRYLDLP